MTSGMYSLRQSELLYLEAKAVFTSCKEESNILDNGWHKVVGATGVTVWR
jgi:hypothetical protein